MDIILSLAITLAIEVPIYMILKHRDMKLFAIASLLNIILNLSMNIGLSYVTEPGLYWLILSLSEVATTLIEATVIYLFMKFKYLKVLLYAFIANLSSFLVGYLLSLTGLYETKIALFVVLGLFLVIYLFSYAFVLTVTILNYRNRNNDSRRDN